MVEKYRCGQYRYGRLLLDSLEPLDERLYGADFTPVTASSNTAGPMYFQMEWADTDNAKTWTPIGNEYVASNWHNSIAAPEYLFVLPDELKDRESFSIRLRATRQRNASDTENTASGTSRIGVVRMSCLDL